jgi:FkbM family methyltransferase
VEAADFGVTLELESTGSYEPLTRLTLSSLLGPGMTFVDIGAHVGLFAVPASQWVFPDGQVFAFEPHPGNRALLEENLTANQCGGVHVIAFAVSDQTGSAPLHISAFNTGDHQLYGTHRGRRTVDVQCTTLDDFFEAGTRIDVIKMDVQGAEGAAFRGMRRVLADNPDIAVIWELSPSQLRSAGDDPAAVLQWLVDAGFHLSLIDDAADAVIRGTVDEILQQCPDDSYMNILCRRCDD